MTVELYPYDIPDGVEMLLNWLEDMVEPGAIGPEKPNGALLPFIRVEYAGGPDDGLTNKGKYAIYVYGSDQAETAALAARVKRRILLLKPPFGGQRSVEISSGTAWADLIKCETLKQLLYVEDTIPESEYLYQGLCEMWLRIAAAS
jgi:hypothetical protein